MTKRLLLSLFLILSLASVYASALGFMKDPAISPDGSQICFVYQEDLWLVAFEGGDARRLTSTSAAEWAPTWSPDGSLIAYNSNREGQSYIYTISPSGGASNLISRVPLSIVDWFNDGQSMLVTRHGFRFGSSFFRLSLSDNSLTLLAEIGDRFASLSPDNSKIIFNRYGDPYREAYTGSLNGDLWELDLSSKAYRRLTSTPTTERYPQHSFTRSSVYFCASDGERFQLMRADNGNYDRPVQLTNFPQWSARDIKIARSSDRVVWELFNEIWAYDPAKPAARNVHKVPINIPEDAWENGRRTTVMRNEFSNYAVSDDELLVTFGYMYDLFAMPRKGGEARQVSFDLNGVSSMLFLKDNRSVLVQRMEKGRDKLFIARIDSTMSMEPVDWFGADSLLIESVYRDASGKIIIHYRNSFKSGNIAVTDDDFSSFEKYEFPYVVSSNFAISPDSTHVAFASLRDDTWMRELYIYEFENKKLRHVLTDDTWIGNITWTPDMKSLLMSRGRDLYRLDLVPRDELEFDKDNWKEIFLPVKSPLLDGPTHRDTLDTVPLPDDESPMPPDDASELVMGDNLDLEELIAEKESAPKPKVEIVWEDLRRRYFPILTDGRSYLRVIKTISDSTFYYITQSYDDSTPASLNKINIYGKSQSQEAVFGKSGASFSIAGNSLYYLDFGQLKSYNLHNSRRSELSARLDYEYDVNLLNRRVFEQVWGAFGINFYDADMHGKDWNRMFEIYSPYLENVRSMSDLSAIIDEMIGDINASHTGFRPRREGESSFRSLAYLPLEFDFSVALQRGIKVQTVYPGTRLSYLYKIQPGALLTHVNGSPITREEPLETYLLDKAGKPLQLVFEQDGKRLEAVVNAVNFSEMRSLHYKLKVETAVALVDELSEGRIGYVHIPAMGTENYTDFYRDLFRDNADKEALIIDVRGNVGGRIHDMIISLLIKQPYGYSTSRRYNREQRIEPSRIWNKPSIVLVDEHSFSDGEIFPIIYQELKLGKVVGFPSSGAVIGTWEYDLIDGSSMRMPSTGWYKLDSTNMEGTGAQPDIVIEHTPNDIISANDLQLKRAISELLEELGS